MAYWNRRGKGAYVCVYSKKNGIQKQLPRKMVKHLDGEPDHNVDAWVANYERQYEGRERLAKIAYDGGELHRLVAAWVAYLFSRGKSRSTVKQHERMIIRYVLPFFLEGEAPLTDPQQWPGKSVKMLAYLQERGVTESVIVSCNKALRSFYSYLADEGRIQNGVQLRLRGPVKKVAETPLKVFLSPDDALAMANRIAPPMVRLMALIGYFFSLRPQELFALKKADFGAGSKVQVLECSKTMRRIGLYEKLAVSIKKQQTNYSIIDEPKADSGGWVSCFNGAAAKAIVGLMAGNGKDDELFPFNNRKLYEMWRTSGGGILTLKDLRRASLYWLGHNTPIQPLELMKHARHRRMETTMLYVRRPEEDILNGDGDLDLES